MSEWRNRSWRRSSSRSCSEVVRATRHLLCLFSAAVQRAPVRQFLLPALSLRDAAGLLAAGIIPPRVGVPDGALAAAVAWLCRSHDVTGRQGSAKALTLLHGW